MISGVRSALRTLAFACVLMSIGPVTTSAFAAPSVNDWLGTLAAKATKHAMSGAAGDAVSTLAGRYQWQLEDLSACKASVEQDFSANLLSLNPGQVRSFSAGISTGQFNSEVMQASTEVLQYLESNANVTLCLAKEMSGSGKASGCSAVATQFQSMVTGLLLKMPAVSEAITRSIKQYCGIKND